MINACHLYIIEHVNMYTMAAPSWDGLLCAATRRLAGFPVKSALTYCYVDVTDVYKLCYLFVLCCCLFTALVCSVFVTALYLFFLCVVLGKVGKICLSLALPP